MDKVQKTIGSQRNVRLAGQVARILDVGNASYKTLVGILQGKKLHDKCEFGDNIKVV